jgi:uncharacterized membrane protein YfcA
MSALDWTVLVSAAILVGFAKTALGGIGALATALFATVLPARQSSGALLPLLIAGDVVAVAAYRRHADWKLLGRLFPSVAAGIVVGALFVARVDDAIMQRTIGVLLVLLVTLTLVQKLRRAPLRVQGRSMSTVFGLLAGFTTMVANAAGPVMSIYLLATGVSMLTFLGTGAWFYFVVNLFKVPFSLALGLIDLGSVRLDGQLLPAMLAGALVGRLVVSRLNQGAFEGLVLFFTLVASVNLLR